MHKRSDFTSSAQFNYRPAEVKHTTQKECLDRNKLKIKIKKASK